MLCVPVRYMRSTVVVYDMIFYVYALFDEKGPPAPPPARAHTS